MVGPIMRVNKNFEKKIIEFQKYIFDRTGKIVPKTIITSTISDDFDPEKVMKKLMKRGIL